ncbi:MAG: hypothetical protein JJU28_24045 [Cyclobacteriaceae bacterium]|nr:hypothetical protein [Cyclobacteriaceae bacterium]
MLVFICGMDLQVEIETTMAEKLPSANVMSLLAEVEVMPSPQSLLDEIEAASDQLRSQLKIEDISRQDAIAQTRQAYKTLGKDPSRYRPSSEALLRRIVGGKSLYLINNLVDLLNLISLRTAFSIGGFDANQIEGKVRLGVGLADEPYEAIGRGQLNIEGLPVLRDDRGAFGTPTSDVMRTRVTEDTQIFRMDIIYYETSAKPEALKALQMASSLLIAYAKAKNIRISD